MAVLAGSFRSTIAVLLATTTLWTTTAVAKDASDYFVHHLPGAPDTPYIKMHAGHVEVTPEHHGNLFFWHFDNQHIANKQRTVIWLNGGPGCSSEDGALMEIGPYRVKDINTLVTNDGSWNEFANLLFVDNPVGTGYSYVDTDSYIHELDTMADEFVTFLEKWFALFPQYEQDDLYIAGESYAGQHIPYIAKHILERNNKSGIAHKWLLKGLLIGNGWISPKDQYEAYIDFAYSKGMVEKSSALGQALEVQRGVCKNALAQGVKIDIRECETILLEILEKTQQKEGTQAATCYNMYDVRLRDTYPSCGMNWPPDLKNVTPYLRKPDVIQALHIDSAKNTGWTECNGAVSSNFGATNSKPSIEYLPDILKQVPVLLFSGAEDLICNHLGTEALISNMEWNGGKGFETTPGNWAPRRDWMFEGQHAGFWQEARDLTYVLFENSSHMVPFDYARRTRDMLDRFMEVDISKIGGKPVDSLIDGEKAPDTTVGGAAGNSTANQEAEKQKLEAAKWAAYQRSGEVILFIAIIAAGVWGWWVWRERSKRHGYQGLIDGVERGMSSITGRGNGGGGGAAATGNRRRGGGGNTALESFRDARGPNGRTRDVEAGDFDESELDDLHVETPTGEEPDKRYSLGGDSDEDEDEKSSKPQGSASRA